MRLREILSHGGTEEMVKALASTGLTSLYPTQALALEAGLLSTSESMVVAAPTASGKTLIAEMAILKTLLERTGKVIYLVPLRALAGEKYGDFSARYRRIRTVLSTGDYDSSAPWLQEADVVIATNEKIDSIIRHRTSWHKDVGLVIADEVHLLGDGHRGPTLEVVLTRLREMHPGLRILALSATIPNASEIAGWLGARLVQSEWRPVPLREGVFHNGAVIFNDGVVKWVPEKSRSAPVDLALETVGEGGQAIIFVNTRKSTEAVARRVSEHLELRAEEDRSLKKLSDQVLGSTREPTRVCRRLADCVSRGAAFHHAGINYSQRKLIEDAFRRNRLKVVVSTTTLAMGLNLPSRRVVIRDWLRYASGLGMEPVPAIEVKQMAGRAGRPGYDDYGEAVVIAGNKRDEKYVFQRYIKGGPEQIESRLASESALRTHILASIAGGFTRTRKALADFLGGTFSAHQEGVDYLAALAEDILDFLASEEMIKPGRALAATRFGRRVSELYIDPLSGVVLRDSMRRPEIKGEFALLHMTARTPDMMHLSARKKDFDELLEIYNVHADELLMADEEKYPSEELLSELKTASVLMQWILETPEDGIVGHFGIGPGDLRTLVDLCDWLLYSASEIAKIFDLKDARRTIAMLRARVAYGVREELLELVSLRGIGRVRARNLYNSGFRKLRDIREAEVQQLEGIPGIGKSIAQDIKRQASGDA